MITLVGIEKVLPRLEDLALFLPMLAGDGHRPDHHLLQHAVWRPAPAGRSRTARRNIHVVLLDNHRTALLADAEQRDSLHCIRCGACLNVCPIFRNVGGHTYGTTYSGPDRRGHHAQPARACTSGSTFPTPRRSAARAPRPAR